MMPLGRLTVVVAAIAALTRTPPVTCNDNGLALTPPMGWRSWNQYHGDVNQQLLEGIMTGIAKRSRTDHLGRPTSLCDLGYCDVGLDDNWQQCSSPRAAPGMNYHDVEGKPIVNVERFPDMKKMTDHAHSLGLTAGFYGNNCICSDKCRNSTECEAQIRGDVRAFIEFNFDSWKLDGCGGENDLRAFDRYLREQSSRPIMVENCHWGNPNFDPDRSIPPAEGCPFNFYRSSGDIGLSYGSVMHNLASVENYRAANLSYPGCWAYPDMLEVGMRHEDGSLGLSDAETRSHFGAWAIVSSPLVLGHDVNDDEVTDAIWDVISNREVIAVNQAYAGDSGGVYAKSSHTVELSETALAPSRRRARDAVTAVLSVNAYQYLSKPLGGGKVAVLLMNSGNEATTLEAKFADIPGLDCGHKRCRCHVRDIWKHKDVGTFTEFWSVSVDSHDAAFLLLEARSTA